VFDSAEIASLIRDLCEADSSKRAGAAAKIFLYGSEMAQAATQQWLRCAPFENLLIRGPSGAPEMTVGVAVEPDTFDRLRSANGSPPLADVPPDQDAREFELEFSDGVRLDVLTTRQPGGPGAIARYLQRFGEGIQQIEINVTDVDRATEVLRARFATEATYPATRAGANGTRINFFLVPAPNGTKVLIELVEAAAKS
jgi:hypothetical protein